MAVLLWNKHRKSFVHSTSSAVDIWRQRWHGRRHSRQEP